MKADKNIHVIVTCLLIYSANQMIIKDSNSISIASIFFKNHLNDVACGCLIIAYANYVLNYYKNGKYKIISLYSILLFKLGCGIFWEYVTPLIRNGSTSDYLDLFAYLFGGTIYWLCEKVGHINN